MLATPGPLPTGPEWVYEVKWDGMRLLAEVTDGELRLATRNGRDVTADFPELAGLTAIAPDLVLDGEVVLLDDGVPSFAALTDRMHGPVAAAKALARPVTFMVFDVLRLYGVPLLERPLHERRATLDRLDTASVPTLALSPLYTDGRALFEATARRGMEGIVAKQRESPYLAGGRSPGWVKVTHRHTQTCLVGGWRPERTGAGTRVGALLLGVPDGGELVFAGKVGSGLAGTAVQRMLSELLGELEQPSPPFRDRPPRADSAGVHWCEPVVAVEVAHLGWTSAGKLREPVFRGVRADVTPQDVRREG
ncbi:non-homologous end-joining DNA ligase [Pseudonocardia pini]|uniref:non-homologous end-joining DNA ligase n=1 Tax=Pseudonocardia pini TaxID=2758030 RepID=UPI001C687ED5|nr:non-homologous end-joining DNA ligase [Pseudonocardia pini]